MSDAKFLKYLRNERGLEPSDYPFKITPNAPGRNKNRIIIPYVYADDVVGWTSRYLDDNKPKYYNEHQQPGFIFGTNMQKEDWEYGIGAEGPMDAISIKGVAVLHNTINDGQLALLRRMDKQVIVVPDQNKAGLYLAEKALAEGFAISIPNWDDSVEDINEAFKYYGRLGTLLSIIAGR